MKRDQPMGENGREWIVRRNCSLTPRQTAAAWALLLALSLAVGLFFTMQGAWYVLVFSALETAAVTAAFIVYAKHAADCDRIVLAHGCVLVEQVRGGQARLVQLDPRWLRVVAPQRRGDPVRLEARGVSVAVGAWLPAAGRQALARELRDKLAP